jgi:hypothetical protein
MKRGDEWQFWQHDNRPKETRADKMTRQKLDYIHYNPSRGRFRP